MNKSGESGPIVNYGTWLSAVHSLANWSELNTIRQQLSAASQPLPPKPKHRLAKRSAVSYSDEVRGWCLPFLGADKSIVHRSMVSYYHHKQETPIQFQPYLRMQNLAALIGAIFAGLLFVIFTRFSAGRSLLEKYPKMMSFGMTSKTGPSRKHIENGSFRMTFVGLGWEHNSDNDSPPNKKITIKLNAPEAGYVTTPVCLIQAAYVILQEKDKLPQGGGVFTPGAGFADTSYLSRLQDHGLTFTVK